MPGIVSFPTSQKALKVHGPWDVRLEHDCPLPQLEDDSVLVRIRCVAINPNDAKNLDMGPILGATLGCEFSGDVAKVGSSVENKLLVEGAKVFGCVYGNHPGQPDNGAFAEYVAIPGDLVYLMPPHLSYQQAATMGVALATVAMSTYYPWKFEFPAPQPCADPSGSHEQSHPSDEVSSPPIAGVAPQYVLVYGGSTTMGAMALQLFRLSGLTPVCTCSPRNFAMVKALGAAEAFDYHAPTCGDEIRKFTNGTLAYAIDCITDLSSMRICYAALGNAGGRYMGLDPLPLRAHTRRDVKPDWTLVFTMFNNALKLPRPFGRPARPKDRAFAKEWYVRTQSLVDTPGQIRPHPIDLGSPGLQSVIQGLDRMRKGDVSGVKLVYEIM